MNTVNRIAVPLRTRAFGGKAPRWQGWLVFAVLLVFWETAVRLGWISRAFIASPSEIVVQLKQLLVSGLLWEHLWASVRRLAIGWGLGTLLGIVIGLLIGLWRVARGTLLPLVSALFPVPKIALLPLFLVWFGIDEGSKVATIAITMLVVAEMMNAESGIGAYIASAGALYQMDQLLAGVTLLALLGIVLSWLLGVIERRVLRWRE